MKVVFDGTSHGEGYSGTVCDLPEGFYIDVEGINEELRLRKCGYGRSNPPEYRRGQSYFVGIEERVYRRRRYFLSAQSQTFRQASFYRNKT